MQKDWVTFEEVLARWSWKPIRNCPGRFTFGEGTSKLTATEIVGTSLPVLEFRVETVPDKVLVMKFGDGGGLISYRKDENKFLHTLNNEEGFSRKLQQLRIAI